MQISVQDNINQVVAALERHRRDVLDKAIPRALNRTAEMARTYTARAVREEGYNFSAAEIKQAITLFKASSGSRTAGLRVKRTAKSLMNFSPRASKAGVSVKVGGQRRMIKGAFIAQRKNGVSGVYVEDKAAGKVVLRFARQYKRGSKGGWHDYPGRKLYGPSVGGVNGTERIQVLMRVFITEAFSDRLSHEIAFLTR